MSVLKIKDQNGNWIQIPTIKGEKGADGQDYVLTENDKQEIAGLVDVPVEDVQIDGTSIIDNGVANIPKATNSVFGTTRAQTNYGTQIFSNGALGIYPASSAVVKSGTHQYIPITPERQHESIFYGLAKASGDTTQAQSNNAVGTYTDEAKASIQSMLGVANKADKLIITIGAIINSTNNIYQIDNTYVNIANALTNGANVIVVNNTEIFPYVGATAIDNTPVLAFGTSTVYNGVSALSGYLITQDDIAARVDQYTTIPTATSQLTNDSLVSDVQVNGTSIINNGVANISIADANNFGVIKIGSDYGIGKNSDNRACIQKATDAQIKNGSGTYRPITPDNQHNAVFYGLAKASGDTTQSASNNTVGTYTDGAKSAIQTMLGVPSADDVVTDVQINGTSVTTDGVANIPVATSDNLGVVRTNSTYGIYVTNGTLAINNASESDIKSGTNSAKPLTPNREHMSTFYGLAKASGDTTQSASDNTVGTYTDGAKSAIQTMLGVPSVDDVVTDVQVNGTSVTTDGVATIPIANGQTTLGLTQYNSTYGVTVNASGRVQIFPAVSSEIKGGTNDRRPITPSIQNESVFYGLAKAAGDTTQSSSSNTVGTYTDSAKTAIKQMLDVKDDYDSLVVEVSGTDPVITGKPSYRYNCGELYTLSVTPPASGTMDIIFTSGTTPTVLTLPNTVKMPDWWAGIETNTTYEMCITDGTYCGVMSWAT